MDVEIKAMNRFAKTALEDCLKELAERAGRELAGMTPLQRNEYFLCRSIEHHIRLDALCEAAGVTGLADYRRKRKARSAERLPPGPATRRSR
jgi:hypothetical protein